LPPAEFDTHDVAAGIGRRPLIVAITRRDMAPAAALRDWQEYYLKEAALAAVEKKARAPVIFVDARQGVEIHRLKMIALKAGAAVNKRSASRVWSASP
jgi:hypothetical protein